MLTRYLKPPSLCKRFLKQQLSNRACQCTQAKQRKEKIDRIKFLLQKENAVLIAHYYTHETLQRIAEETGGYVSDSLEMARFGSRHDATTLIVAGVRLHG